MEAGLNLALVLTLDSFEAWSAEEKNIFHWARLLAILL
jgi:hypothetical protein